jgi:hypothetical protein
MKLYLDDKRKPYDDTWYLFKTPYEVIGLLKTMPEAISEISLDHDLGDDEGIGTGYDVLLYIEEQVHTDKDFKCPKLMVHSANSSARLKMEAAIESIQKRINDNK